MSSDRPTDLALLRLIDGVVTRRGLLGGAAALGAVTLVGTGDAAPTPRLSAANAVLIDLQEDDRNSREAKLARRAKRAAFDDRGVDALVEALAMAGIATYAEAGDADPIAEVAEPTSPFAFLRSQVATMTAHLSTGSGIRAADLDSAFPVPEDIPPPSMLLAGYVFGAQSVGARISRELMRPQRLDPAAPGELVVPMAVQVLFAGELMADAARAAEEAAVSGGALRPMAYRANLAGTCSDAQGFIDEVINAAKAALKVDRPDSGISVVAADTWNFLVDVFADAAKAFVKVLVGPVLEVVQAIATLIGIGGMIAALTQPWTLSLTATPETNQFQVEGGSPQPGELLAVVQSALPDWPAEIADCAGTIGAPLPPLKPKEGVALFTQIQGPIDLIEIGADPVGFVGGEATFGYATLIESKAAAKGEERTGLLTVTATFTRDDLAPLIERVVSSLFTSLFSVGGDTIAGAIADLIGSGVASITADLLAVSKVSSQPVTIPITYHEPKPEDPTAESTSEGDDDSAVGCVIDTWRWDSFFGDLGGDVTYEISGPPYYMVFKANGLMEQSSDGAVVAFTSVSAAGFVSGTVTVIGEAEGTWKGDPDGPIQVRFGNDGFEYTLDAYLDGTPIGGGTFTAREMQEDLIGSGFPGGKVNGTASADCSGDAMQLQPGQSLGINLIRGK